MTEVEKRIIGELQHDLPVTAQPYAAVSARLNMGESQLLHHIRAMLAKGLIRKIGAVLRHRRVGFAANALCVWRVPEEAVAEVGTMFAELASVTHCYERATHPQWPYNLYTMVHAAKREECEALIGAMRDMSGISDYRAFYSTRELKKTSMRYFE